MQAIRTLSNYVSERTHFGFMYTSSNVEKLQVESKDQHWCFPHKQACTLLCITWPVQMTHLSLWCRWYSTLSLVLAMPCPLPGPAACGRILTFISATGPAATDTRSPSDPYAQVPAFTICPSPQRTHTHTKCIWPHTRTGMSDTSWPLAVPPWISRREATCRVRGDFGVKELDLESSHIVTSWRFVTTHADSPYI